MERSDSMEVSNSGSKVNESPTDNEKTLATLMSTDLNLVIVGDPQLDAIIDYILNPVREIIHFGRNGGAEWEKLDRDEKCMVYHLNGPTTEENRFGELGWDPMFHEAQIEEKVNEDTMVGKKGANDGPFVSDVARSRGPCPFPPGFGRARVKLIDSAAEGVVSETQHPSATPTPVGVVEGDSGGTPSVESRSDETRYLINDGVCFGNSEGDCETEVQGAEIQLHYEDGIVENLIDTFAVDVSGEVEGGNMMAIEGVGSRDAKGSQNDEAFSNETLYRINESAIEGERNQVKGSGDAVGEHEEELGQWGNVVDDPSEEEIRIEAVEAKKICGREGIFFYNSNEEEVLARFVEWSVS
ncbi:hypothetical protein PIB30_031964 [Stylosanthes scabra]|uniref:Uncharacterized protein n=1 Tax=Stylosanthes scabra TaxID=79078 RepID=A0ABU6SBR4_9FABA|nr:hypothetical protein [Stylosanthes scabra]